MTDLAHSQFDTSLFEHAESRRRHLQTGDVLIREGDVADSVYVLVEGQLEVSRQLDDESTVLATIDEPGTVVGEIVAMGGGTRTATVTAVSPAEVIGLSAEAFRKQLHDNPDLADTLVALAVRRAEEVELTDLLANHFGIVDQETLVNTCRSVEWQRLNQGETLLNEGDASDAVYFVVRGRLLATTHNSVEGSEVRIGEMGRGDVVGEVGLLSHSPRSATVKAIRDSVVARMDEPTFLDLADSQPRMMIELCLRAVARAQSTRWHSAPSTVLAIVSAGNTRVEGLSDGLADELRRYGKVHRLSPAVVDAALETPGIFDVARGDVGDVRVSRMVHELELEADHLLVEVGDTPGPWSERALGMADRVLIVVPPGLSSEEAGRLDDLLGGCPVAVRRSVVIVRPDGSQAPTESTRLTERLRAADAFNISLASSKDIARLARISVGRGNALVLSGGGGRGFAHIGVYRALTELGFPIDLVGGTSVGAIVGSVIADALSPDEMVRWAQDHFPNALDYTIPIVSLTKGDRIARSAKTTFGDRHIEDLWRTYFAVSTDLTSSRLRIHNSGPIALAIRATSAIPGVMPPVPDGDSLLIDGGVLNNLPIDIARTESPAGKIVAVDVAPPRGPSAHDDYGLSVSGWKALGSSISSGRSRYPRISAVLMRSMITASMLERDTQISSGLADCYLDLDMRGVSMLEFGDPAGVSQRGYEAAMPTLESWVGSLSES